MRMTEATDFDLATLRARRTNKWHKFPADVLPAWVADMDFGVAPSTPAALARLTRDQEYGYAARDGVLAAAFVRRMERRFGWHTDPADTIAISNSRNQHAHGDDCHEAQPRLFPPRSAMHSLRLRARDK